MFALLVLGFLVGVRHALEADHVAAVTTLATRSASLTERLKVAVAWGGGHAAGLVLLGSALILLGTSLPECLERAFEIAAGMTLIALGVDVLRRLRKRRIHFHFHEHSGGARHLHAHAHHHGMQHGPAEHEHEHSRSLMPRALAVGGLHGLAGSGALVLLSMKMLGSTAQALMYVLSFALGSILGMVAFSLMLSLPLSLSPRLLSRHWSPEAVLTYHHHRVLDGGVAQQPSERVASGAERIH